MSKSPDDPAGAVCLNALCLTLDKLGVPRESRWRTLILHMRGVSDYSFLDQEQKSRIQALVVTVLKRKDFSGEAFDRALKDYEAALFGPWRRRLEGAAHETASLAEEFQEVLARRKGDVRRLETTTAVAVQSGRDLAETLAVIKKGFREVVALLEEDAQQLERQSMTDPLTGVGNRRALERFLGNAVETAVKKNAPLAVMMLDIDHFKLFNDEYGHLVGDQALVTVASILKAFVEDMGSMESRTVFPARYGGEEFVLVVPGATKMEAGDLAEIVRVRVSRYNFVIRSQAGEIVASGVKLNVSAGVAEMTQDSPERDPEVLLAAADRALYAAKKAGRNRVVLAGSGDG